MPEPPRPARTQAFLLARPPCPRRSSSRPPPARSFRRPLRAARRRDPGRNLRADEVSGACFFLVRAVGTGRRDRKDSFQRRNARPIEEYSGGATGLFRSREMTMKKMTWIALVLAAAAGCAGVSQSGKQAQE